MSTPGKYGTTSELCAIAEMFGFCFNIVRSHESNADEYTSYDCGSNTNANVDDPKPIAHLLFTGYVSRGHFRLLVPVQDSYGSPIPPGNYALIKDYSSSKLLSLAMARPVVLNASSSTGQTAAAPGDKSNFICDFCGRSFGSSR